MKVAHYEVVGKGFSSDASRSGTNALLSRFPALRTAATFVMSLRDGPYAQRKYGVTSRRDRHLFFHQFPIPAAAAGPLPRIPSGDW